MEEDLRSASNSMNGSETQPAYAPAKKKSPKFNKKILFTLLAVVVLIAAGLAVWKFVLNKPAAKQPQTQQTATDLPATTTNKVPEDVPAASLSETYESTALSVGFKYPKTWKVSEANGGVRIESPAFTYEAMGLGAAEGIFKIYIRQGARAVDGKYIGRGYAIKPSEKLTYTQPALGQRTDTLLSSFGLDDSENFDFFFIAGNFQLAKGDTLGPDYGKEPDTYIIAGGYSNATAVDDLAFTPVSLTEYTTSTAYKQALQIVASLQLK